MKKKNLTMEKEIWKTIEENPNYMVSNLGRVKSLKRIDSNKHPIKERVLKSCKVDGGYLAVVLCENGKRKTFLVHRLVAQAFIPNPNNLPQVNHKDEDKTNNTVENLEYCDQFYNNIYGTRIQRTVDVLINHPKLSRTILQINAETNEVLKEFPSIAEVQRQLGFGENAVRNCAKGRCMTSNGYKWKYKEAS